MAPSFYCQWTQRASHFCKVDPSNADGAIINFGVIPKSDTIYRIYAYDASQQNTMDIGNRISDCYIENTAVDTTQDRQEKDITVDFNAVSQPCGVYLTGTTVKTMTVVFRSQASAGLYTGDDVVYRFQCYSDQLDNQEVATPGYSGSEAVEVELLEPHRGVRMFIRHADTHFPLNTVEIGTKVYLSIEFEKGKDEGQDNYGTEFFVGFLGNDIISDTAVSSELLFIAVIPRDNVKTFVNVTSVHGSESRVTENQVLVFILNADLMGCSDDGLAELTNKGIEISTSHEVSVLVCNRETDTEDCYTAFPLDVLDTDYYAVSKNAINEISELMIIASEDSTNVELTLPSYTGLSVTLDSDTKNAGETLTFVLQKRETFHLAVTSQSSPESVSGFKIHADKLVSVVSGNRKYGNDHLAEQIPGISKLGKHYVLTPADPTGDGSTRETTYIIQATEDGDTTVQQYTSSSAFQTHTISAISEPTYISVTSTPCELISDKKILVAQIVGEPSGASGFEPALLIMPSVQQWSSKYSTFVKDSPIFRATFVFPSETAAADLKTLYGGTTLTTPIASDELDDVLGPSGYKFFSARPLTANAMFTFTSTNAITQFLMLLYATNGNSNTGSAFLPFGLRYPTTDECPTIAAKQGDLLDNDCDGRIDEELLNLLDDDNDSLIDEDLVNSVEEFVNAVAIRPYSCQASGLNDFSDATKLKPVTDSDGCASTEAGNPFAPDAEFTTTETTAGKKIYNSGKFDMAMFEEENSVNFKCELNICLQENDAACTPICQQQALGRRKREERNETSVVTVVQVVPKTSDLDTCPIETKHEMDPMTCLENSYILSVFIVLLVLLALSFSTAICFCWLFRKRRNENKTRTHYWFYRKS